MENAKQSVSKLINADYVVIPAGFDFRLMRSDLKEAKQIVKTEYDKLRQIGEQKPSVTVEALGKQVNFSGRGFKEATSHSADRRVLLILTELPSLFRNAVFLYSEKAGKGKQEIIAYHYLAGKADFGIKGLAYVLLVVEEQKNGQFFYDADATEVEMIKAIPTIPLADQTKTGAGDVKTASKGRLAKWIDFVNEAKP